MITEGKLPLVIRNVGATRVWRPRDMVNWHRMVRPLRTAGTADTAFDWYHLVFDCCSSFAVDYLPRASEMSPIHGPTSGRKNQSESIAIFADSPDHMSGVATALRNWSSEALRTGHDLAILHSGDRDLFENGIRFPPIGTLRLGVYEGLQLGIPSVTAVMSEIRRRGCTAVHVSTPGPMGLIGLAVARELGVPAYGTYHTDFPAYAAQLAGDPRLEHTAWRFMRWFYGQLERVAAPSAATRERLVWHGLDGDRISVVGRGIDPDLYSPSRRNISRRAAWGDVRADWLLYAGRLSAEKNLACLAAAFKQVAARRPGTGLVIAGDGPMRAELEAELRGLQVVFTGMCKGEELAEIYASADLFVFPSETDTLGVVLLEAQASGLPVLVSAEGGPKSCIVPDRTGRIVRPMNASNLARAIDGLLAEPHTRTAMGVAAREHAAGHSWQRSFSAFWNLHHREVVAAEVA